MKDEINLNSKLDSDGKPVDKSYLECNLPSRRNFLASISWLKAVCDRLNQPIVFALDQALMCQELFLGRNDEFIVWLYGDKSLEQFNGVVVLGDDIDSSDVEEHSGLLCTSFNRTIADSIAYEAILDMQGITEALSNYYFANGECFKGIALADEYQERFTTLAKEAIDYYNY